MAVGEKKKDIFIKHVGTSICAQIKEPYLVSKWQLGNLRVFFEALLETTQVRHVLLTTHARSKGSEEVLSELQGIYRGKGLQIEVVFNEDLHVREILYSNGVCVSSDRGLDVYRMPGADGIRHCRVGQVLYFEAAAPHVTMTVSSSTRQDQNTSSHGCATPLVPTRADAVKVKRMCGHVKRFFADRDYGFIATLSCSDAFFTTAEAPPFTSHDDWVEFEMRSDGRGRYRAYAITRLPIKFVLAIQAWWRLLQRRWRLRAKHNGRKVKQRAITAKREHEAMLSGLFACLDAQAEEEQAWKDENPCRDWNSRSLSCRHGDNCRFGHSQFPLSSSSSSTTRAKPKPAPKPTTMFSQHSGGMTNAELANALGITP